MRGDTPSSKPTAEELKARYQAEREKRLRPDGNAQYRPIGGLYAEFDRDPYASPLIRHSVEETVDVIIIGAGLGGMSGAARLVQQGVDSFRIIDKAGDFGGTWYWNRYPGAACDVESYIYMPFLEETNYVPTEKYAKAGEIFAHCQRVGQHFDLYRRALFQTNVTDLSWDDAVSLWRVETDRGDRIAARFAIVAGGIMHKAKLPGIPGIENYKGTSFHTARWNYAYTGGSSTTPMENLRDKRVALIGTGATAVQVLPKLADSAHQVHVFQRTPAGVGVRDNRPTDPEWAASLEPGWQQKRIENFSRIVSGQPVDEDLVGDGWTEIFLRNPHATELATEKQQRLDFEAMEKIRKRVEETVGDGELAEALKPWYNQMCKRPCFHDEYLSSFNRPNVNLVDTRGRGVELITEDAVVADGVSYPVDCIVFASGFEMGSSYTSRLGFEIHGRGGKPLTQAWSKGPATLYGMFARGFPNLIMFTTTQTAPAINFSHLLSEFAIHAAWFVRQCLAKGIAEIEPRAEVQEDWAQTIRSTLAERSMFIAQCTPSYFNGEGGRSSDPNAWRQSPYFGPTYDYFDFLQEWRATERWQDMEIRGGAGQSSGLAEAASTP
ncbi:MAG TPA: NAD(P)/FAD-dependent oxidoreductase [Novosphingobium sp.]|nr:NAD(P)/FAD-dependent oxidoreductase [Novosphingobium sp.]